MIIVCLLYICSTRIYVYSLTAWYDARSHQEVVDGKLFSLILV